MIDVSLIEQTAPCASCETDDERWVVIVTKNVVAVEQLCLTCACSLNSKLQKLLREIPQI